MSLNNIDLVSEVTEARLVTGIGELDKVIGSLGNGLITVSGASGTGKTALALQLATDCKQSALVVSCEMSLRDIVFRVLSRYSNLKLSDLVSSKVESKILTEKQKLLNENTPFLHLENGVDGFVSIEALKALVSGIKAKDGSSKVLIIIDSVNTWLANAVRENITTDKIAFAKNIATQLNDFAKECGVTVMCVVQKSDTNDEMKDIESIFQYESDHKFELSWERAGRERDGLKLGKFNLAKSRTSATGTFMFDFKGENQDFKNFIKV